MENLKQKSGILTWGEENINETPASPGLYILRASPINGDILSIEPSVDIKESLLKIFKEKKFENIKFFDWYTTDRFEDAEIITKELKTKYSLR